ncbi:MAG TPA: hypothetical protein VHL10_04395, partial [Nitrososphaera sp.]|nr:hypothetical protein [Nitrososphaera sp.]
MPAAIPVIAAVAGAAISAKGSKDAAKIAAEGSKQKLDPRLDAILYGSDGNVGLLQQIASQANQSRPAGQQAFGQGIDSYLGGWGLDNFMRSQQSAQRLQDTVNAAPQAVNTKGVGVNLISGSQIKAPSQNSLNLRDAFQNAIYGDAGANPYLTRSIQSGIDLSRAGFNQAQADATRNLQENVLPGIRSDAIASGQYGGSRQGIAEGRALGDFGRAQQQALTQFGLGATNAAVGAQANAFNQGQDRSLSALLNLSGQQYGTAQQQAQLNQQANLANQNAFQNAETTNANLRQGVNLANLNSQLDTIRQNDARNIAGNGLSSGLLSQAFGFGNQTGNADLSRLQSIANTLQGFTGFGGTTSQ